MPCGRNADDVSTPNMNEEDPCTLCHLIIGFWNLINYGLRILVFIGITGITIAGIMYILSAGSEQMMTTAKNFIKYVLYGAGIVLGGWLLVFVVMNYFGVKSDLGIGKTSWYQFECDKSSQPGRLYTGPFVQDNNNNNNNNNPSACPKECCLPNSGFETKGCTDPLKPYCHGGECKKCWPAGVPVSSSRIWSCCSGSANRCSWSTSIFNVCCDSGDVANDACTTGSHEECKQKGYAFCKNGKCQACLEVGAMCNLKTPFMCCSGKCEWRLGDYVKCR